MEDNTKESEKVQPESNLEPITINSLLSLSEWRKEQLQKIYEHNQRVSLLTITERNNKKQ